MAEFREFPKIARLRREIVVTEKLDGTNACVVVDEIDGTVSAQSRSRIITPEADNYGFARWVSEHVEELKLLGPGYHYGEWWGAGIQRRYGLLGNDKRFSLFNTGLWNAQQPAPACCSVVPVLAHGCDFVLVDQALRDLKARGSVAAPGFMQPEGVVIYHTASRMYFKQTLEDDGKWKGKQRE